MWNIVIQNNWYFQKGFPSTADRVHYVLNFQPVLSIPLTRELNLVMRPVVPLESNPYARGVGLHPLGLGVGKTFKLGGLPPLPDEPGIPVDGGASR